MFSFYLISIIPNILCKNWSCWPRKHSILRVHNLNVLKGISSKLGWHWLQLCWKSINYIIKIYTRTSLIFTSGIRTSILSLLNSSLNEKTRSTCIKKDGEKCPPKKKKSTRRSQEVFKTTGYECSLLITSVTHNLNPIWRCCRVYVSCKCCSACVVSEYCFVKIFG